MFGLKRGTNFIGELHTISIHYENHQFHIYSRQLTVLASQ